MGGAEEKEGKEEEDWLTSISERGFLEFLPPPINAKMDMWTSLIITTVEPPCA